MTQEELFAAALQVQSPWFISQIQLDLQSTRLDITIDFKVGSSFYYEDKDSGICGDFKAYDTCVKTWRHLNFFQYQCYLHAHMPRVDTGDGKVRMVKAPWEGFASGFTLLFEALVLQLVKQMPVHQVAAFVGTYDTKIWNIMHAYRDACRELEDYSKVTSIGVDETAARRGHDYVTLFVDLDERKTIFVTKGKDSDTIKEFAEDLKEHHGDPQNIESVSCDMSPAFIKGVEEYLQMPPSSLTVFTS